MVLCTVVLHAQASNFVIPKGVEVTSTLTGTLVLRSDVYLRVEEYKNWQRDLETSTIPPYSGKDRLLAVAIENIEGKPYGCRLPSCLPETFLATMQDGTPKDLLIHNGLNREKNPEDRKVAILITVIPEADFRDKFVSWKAYSEKREQEALSEKRNRALMNMINTHWS